MDYKKALAQQVLFLFSNYISPWVCNEGMIIRDIISKIYPAMPLDYLVSDPALTGGRLHPTVRSSLIHIWGHDLLRRFIGLPKSSIGSKPN